MAATGQKSVSIGRAGRASAREWWQRFHVEQFMRPVVVAELHPLKLIFSCYNAILNARQNVEIAPLSNKNAASCNSRRFLFRFGKGGLDLRLVAFRTHLSSHLQT
jgi:hypothetical protein